MVLDVLTAVRRVPDQGPIAQIDDEIQVPVRQLTDQDRHVVGDLHHVEYAVAALNGTALRSLPLKDVNFS